MPRGRPRKAPESPIPGEVSTSASETIQQARERNLAEQKAIVDAVAKAHKDELPKLGGNNV